MFAVYKYDELGKHVLQTKAEVPFGNIED